MSNNLDTYKRELRAIAGKIDPAHAKALHDAGHYAPLIESMLPAVLTIAGRLVHNGEALHSEFEDLVQAGNVSVVESVHSWKPDGGSNLSSYLWPAIRRDMLRENARQGYQGEEFLEEGYEAEDDNAPQARAEVAELADAIMALQPSLRRLITMHYYQDLSYREIQAMTGVNYKTVERRVTAAVEELRAALSQS
jgi:RNA polymerase sigma-70 factor (ECF subfamily)